MGSDPWAYDILDRWKQKLYIYIKEKKKKETKS